MDNSGTMWIRTTRLFGNFTLQSLLCAVKRFQQGPFEMQQDRTGWHFAPAGKIWCCPDCNVASSIDEWSRCTIIDEQDQAEDARLCPECGSIIAAAGSASIAARNEKMPPGIFTHHS